MAITLIKRLRAWMDTRRFWCNLTAAIVAIVIVSPLTFWSLDRGVPFELRNGYTIPSQVQAGGTYRTSWEVRHIRSCPGTVTVSIVDSQNKITSIVSQPSYFIHLGETGKFVRAESKERVMPESVSPGPARIYIDNEFYCNPVQSVLRWPITIKHPPIHTEIIR